MNRNYIFSSLLALLSLVACDNTAENRSINTLQIPDTKSINIFIGQVYPSRHAIFQAVPDNGTKPGALPDTLSIYPLYKLPNRKKVQALQATFLDKISNSYVPALENMSDLESSKCTPESYKPDTSYHYLLKDVTLIQDYFSRGMPDNCEKHDDGARYRLNNNVSASYPVIAVPSGTSLNMDFTNSGKPRQLLPAEKKQVSKFIDDFRTEFKKLYGSEYDEKTNNIGEISTLANARVLLEAEYGTTGYSIRISTWEHISPAYHIYRIIEVSILKDDKFIESREIHRHQGVLG